jgi:mannose-6-phosphate isomerase
MTLRKMEPVFQERVWGSTELQPWFPNANQKIGEVWFEEPDSPILIKFLFTTETLSVQVHPADDYAHLHHDSPGKTEMWHVLAAEPGAKIAAGFRKPVTKDQVRAAALSGEIVDLLEWFDASKGDTFLIPARTVHAIGGGLTICEIQQRSYVTYRLFDYFRGRELHLDPALDVCDLGPYQPRVKMPVESRYFSVNLLASQPESDVIIDPISYQVFVVLAGDGEMGGNVVTPGQALRATDSGRLTLAGNLEILHISLPINGYTT